jgi:hypothetical protein
MYVCFVCCVLCRQGTCEGLIILSGDSYLKCVCVCVDGLGPICIVAPRTK